MSMTDHVHSVAIRVLAGAFLACTAAAAAGQTIPPRPIVPEIRSGFPIRKAADYGLAAADYDGDGRADISVKLDGGTWRIDRSGNGFGSWDETVYSYGDPYWVPAPADYDGDGRADLAVKDVRSGAWRIDYAIDGFGTWNVQRAGCSECLGRAVPADYDSDGRDDIAIKTDMGRWRIDYAAGGFGTWDVQYSGLGGLSSDPVPADYDGDGRVDIAVKEDSGFWRIDYAAGGLGAWQVAYPGYGGAGAHAVPADYDGDGRADLAVKTDDAKWKIDYASNGYGTFDAVFGGAGGTTARAVPADYDGDGRTDLAVRVDCGGWFLDFAAGGLGSWNQRYDHMAATGTAVATTAADLGYTLASDFQGTVSIPSSANIDLTGIVELPVRSCVRIAGTRRGLDPGALVYTDYKGEEYALFRVTGHDVRIEGVRLRGPSDGDRSDSQPGISGIVVATNAGLGLGGNVAIENVDAWFWTGSAVAVDGQVGVDTEGEVPFGTPLMSYDQAGLVRVSRNFIHHNSRDGRGYGVTVNQGAYATIEANLFDHNRHAIASNGRPHTGYVARFNYVLEGGYTEDLVWNQHFDVHGRGDGGYGGVAGERFEIALNTFRGDQTYFFGAYTRPAFWLRGTPTIGAYFHDNVLEHGDQGKAVRLESPDCWVDLGGGWGYYSPELCHLNVGPNTYGVDTTGSLGVGDFDGDGRDDVFLANGTGWWYSSAGLTEWRFLQASALPVSELRFGRFDSDLKTDVVFSAGGQWYFSSGGTAAPVARAGFAGLALANAVFGNFDGTGRVDTLYLAGSSWYLSPGSQGTWSLVRDAPALAANLRVGDFDGDGRDDVFLIENGTWSWWKPGWANSAPLNGPLTATTAGLVVADFDGDGRDDVAQTSGASWRWSSHGSSAWMTLRNSSWQPQYADITRALLGRFGEDAAAMAIRYELVFDGWDWDPGVRFVAWNATPGDAFTQWSEEYVR
jgi:hypothetical protein